MNAVYWLSFVDPDQIASEGERQPGGPGFLGVAIVRSDDPIEAVKRAHALGINPGGEVGIMGPLDADLFPEEAIERLLTKEEAMAL